MSGLRKQLVVTLRGTFFSILCLVATFSNFNDAHAQTCGAEYVIKEGESLGDIANRVYGKASQWTLIYYTNRDRIGENASLLVPGLRIKIPCIGPSKRNKVPDISKIKAAPSSKKRPTFELSRLVRRIDFLTADGYQPFAGRSQQNGGMLTHLLTASMDLIKAQAKGGFDYGISWVNDRSAHLNPLLTSRAFDVGYPWTKPDCINIAELDKDSRYRCQNFFYSSPLYEVVIAVFTKKKSQITFENDDELLGKTLCQTAGSPSYVLDKSGRNWVKENKIVLMQPQTIEECFRLLDGGTVDAVIAGDLTGRTALASLGMTDKIRVSERPLALSTLHVIVSKTHPNARTIMYYVNQAMKQLKNNGEFTKIVDNHLLHFWAARSNSEISVPTSAPKKAKPDVAKKKEKSKKKK